MTAVEKTARSVDEAIEAALAELGAPRDQVEIEVLQEPGRTFLGILGHSDARVRVSLRETVGQKAKQCLADMVHHMEIPAQVELLSEDAEEAALEITGPDLGILIGKHGHTLGAIQLLVALIANRGQEHRKRVLVDAQGYRARREQALRAMAQNTARKVRHSGRDAVLEDLAPSERRIIHVTLAEEEGVTTRSIGDEPFRKIIISATSGPQPEPPADEEPQPPDPM